MSEEKMEHSPLPWKHDYYTNEVLDADGDAVIREAGYYGGGKFSSITPDNQTSDFIVTACNSYYDNKAAIAELVEALEQNNAFVERLIGFVAGTYDIKAANLADHMNGLLAINDEILTKHKASK